jgi:hypothetical protein
MERKPRKGKDTPSTGFGDSQRKQLYQTILLLSGVGIEEAKEAARVMNPRTFRDSQLLIMFNDAVQRQSEKSTPSILQILEEVIQEESGRSTHPYDLEIAQHLESLGVDGIAIISVVSDVVVGLNTLTASDFRLSDFVHPNPHAGSKVSYYGFFSIWQKIGLLNTIPDPDSLPSMTIATIQKAKDDLPFKDVIVNLDKCIFRNAAKINQMGGWPTVGPQVKLIRSQIGEKYFKKSSPK